MITKVLKIMLIKHLFLYYFILIYYVSLWQWVSRISNIYIWMKWKLPPQCLARYNTLTCVLNFPEICWAYVFAKCGRTPGCPLPPSLEGFTPAHKSPNIQTLNSVWNLSSSLRRHEVRFIWYVVGIQACFPFTLLFLLDIWIESRFGFFQQITFPKRFFYINFVLEKQEI